MKLIKLQDKFILVSDEAINVGDWYWDSLVSNWKNVGALKMIGLADGNSTKLIIQSSVGTTSPISTSKKIIAGIPELPSIDFSLLSEEDCLKIGWVDVEKLAEYTRYGSDNYPRIIEAKKGFKQGFKTAQSLNDKKFSLQDMKKIIAHVEEIKDFEVHMNEFHYGPRCCNGLSPIAIEEFIQSLQQTSWDVEIIEQCLDPTCDGVNRKGECITTGKPKITNNSIKVLKIK